MRQINRIIVSAVLTSKDKKILLGKVREGGVYPNCWHIPGGGVEKGEDKITALVREINEEVGLDIKNVHKKLLSDSNTGQAYKKDKITKENYLVNMHFYVYQVHLELNSVDIKISLNDDLTNYQWISFKNLHKYKHTPPSKKLFTSLGWI